MEPVSRLGSFGVMEHRKPIGFRFPHITCMYAPIVYWASCCVNSKLTAVCTHPPNNFMDITWRPQSYSWDPQRTHPTVDEWTSTCSTQLLVAKPCWVANDSASSSIGWGKMTTFFVPILILWCLVNHPKPWIPRPRWSPVALCRNLCCEEGVFTDNGAVPTLPVVWHCDGQEFLGPCSITERVLVLS